jgi:hypothetical protein
MRRYVTRDIHVNLSEFLIILFDVLRRTKIVTLQNVWYGAIAKNRRYIGKQ